METAAERKARLKAMRAAAEETGVVPARDAADECVPEQRTPPCVSECLRHAFNAGLR